MARARLLNVPWRQRRHHRTGRKVRLDHQPQLRWPARTRRAHASGEPNHGRRGCCCWAHRGRAQARHLTMEKFTLVTGAAAPLMRINIDTEVVIPINRLIGHKRGELGRFCFEPWRYTGDGTENPEFVLNQARYRAAKILVAGDNFGCGSSREHAVWSLADFGFRCIIAPSFGDIFYWNCFQNGLLPIRLPE